MADVTGYVLQSIIARKVKDVFRLTLRLLNAFSAIMHSQIFWKGIILLMKLLSRNFCREEDIEEVFLSRVIIFPVDLEFQFLEE